MWEEKLYKLFLHYSGKYEVTHGHSFHMKLKTKPVCLCLRISVFFFIHYCSQYWDQGLIPNRFGFSFWNRFFFTFVIVMVSLVQKLWVDMWWLIHRIILSCLTKNLNSSIAQWSSCLCCPIRISFKQYLYKYCRRRN